MLLETNICDFCWKAAPFSLSAFDGTEHTLESLRGPNGLLLAFICNHCPYVQGIIDRLVTDANELQNEGVGVAAIMSNDYQNYSEDSPAKMAQYAKSWGLTFPYLVDEDQSVAKTYGAVCTPDFFGFDKTLELQYRGRLDSAGMNDPTGRTPELLNAMRIIAQTGKGPKEQFSSMGCSIKWR
ncbi:MAG: thioredoxin family protein [Pseudomonadota bacterium]